MKRVRNRSLGLASITTLFITLTAVSGAFAQNSGKSVALEEVVVTAERRTEMSQDVPISMTVLDRGTIARNIMDAYDVADMTPNVSIQDFHGFATAQYSIRGASTEDLDPFSSTPLLVYFDSLPVGSETGSHIPLWDMDRIEIQRGPQGTLYGRNATAGAIQYISATPTDEFEGYGEFSVGQYDLREFEGAVSGPITEDIKARVSALTRSRGGDVFNTLYEENQGAQDWWGIRGIMDWQITDQLDARAKVQHFEGSMDVFFWSTVDLSTLPAPFRNFYATMDPSGTGDLSNVNPGIHTNYEEIRSSIEDPSSHIDHDIYALDLNYDFGDILLTMNGGVIEADAVFSHDYDGMPAPLIDGYSQIDAEQQSIELRLSSQTSSPFQWITGAFYLSEEVAFNFRFDETALFRDLDGDGLTRHNGDSFEDTLDGLLASSAGIRAGQQNLFETRSGSQEMDTWALFLHTTYDWTDRLTTTHAVRYTYEQKDFTNLFRIGQEVATSPGVVPGTNEQFSDLVRWSNANGLSPTSEIGVTNTYLNSNYLNGVIGNPLVDRTSSNDWSEFSWRFAADYRLMEDMLVFGSVSKGFKGGGYAGFVSSPAEQTSVEPETLLAYELGMKSEWFNKRLRLNVTGFFNDYEGYQTNTDIFSNGIFTNIYTNLPATEMYGAEIEVQAVPIENLFIAANIGLLETSITEVDPGSEDLLGNQLPLAENFNTSGLIRYNHDTQIGTFSPQFSWRYRGYFYSKKTNEARLGNFWEFDARIDYESMDGRFYGALAVNNMFDEVQPVYIDNAGNRPLGFDLASTNRHRHWMLTAGLRF